MHSLFKVYIPEDPIGVKLEEILRSGKLTSGNYLAIFEKYIQDFIGNPYFLLTGSNTYASLIALALCGLKNDDEVIASPMACLASNQPVLNFGAKMVWADIDPLTGTLDPDDVKRKITSKTKAILHYHWGGYPGHVEEINNIGAEFGIKVIDDAIESFGALYKNKKIGNLGTDITTFSFQTVRLPNSIDGGGLSFKDEALYKKALLMRDFGIDRSSFRDEYNELSTHSDITDIGYNGIMNEMSAYIGVKVMEQTPALIENQRQTALIWDQIFQNKDKVRKMGRTEISPNYWIYSFLTDHQHEDMLYFRSKGFYASKVHVRNDHYSCFGEFTPSLLGVADFAKRQLSVPCGWWINSYDLENAVL